MAYYTSGFEDVPNWPFSVRYTASPYRKSKFPVVPSDSSTSATFNNTNNHHQHILNGNSSSASSTNSNSSNNSIDCHNNTANSTTLRPHQILFHNNNNNAQHQQQHNHLHTQQSQAQQQQQFHQGFGNLTPQQQQQAAIIWNSQSHTNTNTINNSHANFLTTASNNNPANSTVPPYGNLYYPNPTQQTGESCVPFQPNNQQQEQIIYQREYCSLNQIPTSQQQQSYLQSFIPADHHHYGLPVSQFSQQQQQQQNLQSHHNSNNNTNHFLFRSQQNGGQFILNGDTDPNSALSNPFTQVDGQLILDEGYIEDLKQPYGLPPGNFVLISSNSGNSNSDSNSSGHHHHHQQHHNLIHHHHHQQPNNAFDYNPYSYVYDSQIISAAAVANHKSKLLSQNDTRNNLELSKFNSNVTNSSTSTIIERLQREALALQAAAANSSGTTAMTQVNNNRSNKHPPGFVNTSPSLSMKQSTIVGKGLTRSNSSSSKSQHGSRRSSFENEYEEISDVARYMTMTSPPMMLPENGTITNNNKSNNNSISEMSNNSPPAVPQNNTSTKNGLPPPLHFKSFSSTDDILAEVVQVQERHDRVLDQLNLEVENLLIRSSSEIIIEASDNINKSSPTKPNRGNHRKGVSDSGLTSSTSMDDHCYCNLTSSIPAIANSSNSKYGLVKGGGSTTAIVNGTCSSNNTNNGGDNNMNSASCLNGAGDYCCEQSIIDRTSLCRCSNEHEKGKTESCGGPDSYIPCSNNYCSCCNVNNDITSGGVGGFYNNNRNGSPCLVPNNNSTPTAVPTFTHNTNSLVSSNRKKKLERIFGVAHSKSIETIANDKNYKLIQHNAFTCNGIGIKNGTCGCSTPLNNNKTAIVKSNSTTSAPIKHHRSYSLIPHWKIRDHLMRLPFLRQNSNNESKLKKSASETNSLSRSLQSSKKYKQQQQQQQPLSTIFTPIVPVNVTTTGQVSEVPVVSGTTPISTSIPPHQQQQQHQQFSFQRDFGAGRGNKLLRRNINSYIATPHLSTSSTTGPNSGVLLNGNTSSSFIMTSVKARSSSMDELRPTVVEEHWYSADSDTDADGLTLLQQQQIQQEHQALQQQQQEPPGDNGNVNYNGNGSLSALGIVGNNNNNTNSIMTSNNNLNSNTMTSTTTAGMMMNRRNSAENANNSQSRHDISAIPDVPKAPKFRRGPTSTASGLKEKWRESWTQSKTLSKNNLDDDNRLLRWFSLRKNQGANNTNSNQNSNNGCSNSQEQQNTILNNHRNSTSGTSSTLQALGEEDLKRISFLEDEEGYWPRRTVQPPSLPPPPLDLTPQQLTRRHIVAAIVHTENNYVATLQRLVNEYKKCLEGSHPALLSHSKIQTIFHRLPEILQCHSLFRIALAEHIRKWDKEEKIGDVFVASFSKSLVLDVYSEFINNFGNAMETAKSEARRKSVFAEFLKIKQITAHDRLSLFGLMVKPVQRFPQFILLLQDLLKQTPKDHHDRMSLQLALTQLESLAAMLNERKRESEQYQAFRETIKSISGGKFVLLRSVVDDPNRILLRQDVVTQLEFDSNGGSVAKSKCRKLLLLNDLLICVSLNQSSSNNNSQNSSHERNSSSGLNKHYNESSVPQNSSWSSSTSTGKGEKSVFKWSYRVQEVEVDDIAISPTMSRLVPHSHPSAAASGSNSRLTRSTSLVPSPIENETQLSKTLLEEMQSLMYDYEVLSRILSLVSTLKTTYNELNETTVKELMLEIQHQIRCRDEQISYFDSSCLTLLLGNPNSNNREKVVFQMASPAARNEWIEEFRLAQLALDPNNSPGWDIPSESPYPSHKLPLFVRALPLCRSPNLTTVKCGCFFTHTFVSPTGRSKILDYLWVSSTDGISSHVTAFRSQQNTLKEVSSFDLMDERINDLLFVSGYVWVATENQKILIFDPADPDLNKGSVNQLTLSSNVAKLTLFENTIYAGLADGHLAIFTKIHNPKGNIEPDIILELGSERITSLFGSREHIYASCGSAVVIIDAKTYTIEKNVVLTHHNGPITHMACSGVGLWVSTGDSGTVCLYHLESLQHLQDVSIAPSVFRTVRDSYRRQKGCHVTCLTAHKGWLWIGTNLGIVLTIPLPRLEGVPIISTGKANVSFHGYYGPVTFLMPLIKQALPSTQAVNTTKSQKTVKIATDEVIINQAEINQQEQLDKLEKEKDEHTNDTEKQTDEDELLRKKPTSGSKNTSLDISPQTSVSSGLSGSHDGSGNESLASGITPHRSSSLSPSSSINNPNKSLVVLRKKNSRDSVFTSRNCKTLPRPGGQIPTNLRFSIDSDVYGLYGNLINVRGLEEEGRFFDPLYDALRRSDPELIALDSKITTMDRRLKMRMSRPRSLDLSNWSVDSKISVSSDESGGGGTSSRLSGGSSTHAIESNNSHTSPPTTITRQGSDSKLPTNPTETATESTKEESSTNDMITNNSPSTNTSRKTVGRSKGTNKNSPVKTKQERTIIVVVGGRGYINMKSQPTQDHYLQHATSSQNDSGDIKHCTHLTIWQMKT